MTKRAKQQNSLCDGLAMETSYMPDHAGGGGGGCGGGTPCGSEKRVERRTAAHEICVVLFLNSARFVFAFWLSACPLCRFVASSLRRSVAIFLFYIDLT